MEPSGETSEAESPGGEMRNPFGRSGFSRAVSGGVLQGHVRSILDSSPCCIYERWRVFLVGRVVGGKDEKVRAGGAGQAARREGSELRCFVTSP